MLASGLHVSSLATLSPQDLARTLASLTEAEADELLHDWRFTARPEQVAPPGDWQVWAYIAGRGAGKTRSGAEWVREKVKSGCRRIALIAPTAGDARDVMVEGESGILSVCWAGDRDHRGSLLGRPIYEPSKRRVTWANGAIATTYSADEPERLRGPQSDAGWCDEVGAWNYAQDSWDMFMLGLRLGDAPQAMVTTTPRTIPVLRQIMKSPNTVVTRGSTYDNRANLADSFVDKIVSRYEGTRLGRQEILGEMLEDVEGALFNAEMFRRVEQAPTLGRIVIAVDPSGARSMKDVTADEIGIVAAGLGQDGRAYVLEDLSFRAPPSVWAKAIERAYKRHLADCVVVESNYGGPMAEALIRTIDPAVRVKNRTAARAKHVRAEPIAGLYEQGRVVHVGRFPELEDQLCQFTVAGYVGPGSPDRADALVWAIDELIVSGAPVRSAQARI